MSKSSEDTAATRREILDRLVRCAGDDAVAQVEKIAKLLGTGRLEQGRERLTTLDAQIGGYGIHSRLEADAAGEEPYESNDRPLYRPIDYVIMGLNHPQLEWYARDIAEMACVHVEGVIKRFVERRNLLERFRRSPLGRLLHTKPVKKALPHTVWEDLCWLNREVYTHAKHEFGWRDEAKEERGGHLFTLEEALAIYVIARHLGVEVTQATERAP